MKPSDLSTSLMLNWAARRPTIITSSPGVGKTSIAIQTARRLWGTHRIVDGVYEMVGPERGGTHAFPRALRKVDYTFRLSDRGIEEMKGLFLPNPQDPTRTIQTEPDWFPQEGDGLHLLLLDEYVQAEMAKQAWGRELVLERRINEENVLPDNVVICLTGNRLEDNAGVNTMPSHAVSALVHLELDVHEPDWRRWAIKKGLSMVVINWVRFSPTWLDTFDPDRDGPYACPRSIEILADKFTVIEHVRAGTLPERLLPHEEPLWRALSGTTIPTNLEQDEYAGTIGVGEAAAFMGFVDMYRSLPMPETCIARPTTTPVPTEPSAQCALAMAIAQKTSDDNAASAIQYLERLDAEVMVLAVDEMIGLTPSIQYSRTFVKWLLANEQLAVRAA